MILSLQEMSPIVGTFNKSQQDMRDMEMELEMAMARNNLSRLDLYRAVAVPCEEFIIFAR